MSPPPARLAVDVALFTIRGGRLCLLVVERTEAPFRGRSALPGGFACEDETLDAAAVRHLAVETGVEVDDLPSGMHLEQLATYGDPGRDPRGRVVSVAYMGMIPGLPAPTAGPWRNAAKACWLDVDRLADVRLAFDHATIVADALERVRAKVEYTSLAAAFVEEPFSLSDLWRVYQAVWGVRLDLGNFRRKVLGSNGFVVPAGAVSRPGRRGGKPGMLYRRGRAVYLYPPMLRPGRVLAPP